MTSIYLGVNIIRFSRLGALVTNLGNFSLNKVDNHVTLSKKKMTKTNFITCRVTSEEKIKLFTLAQKQKTSLSGALRNIINKNK